MGCTMDAPKLTPSSSAPIGGRGLHEPFTERWTGWNERSTGSGGSYCGPPSSFIETASTDALNSTPFWLECILITTPC